MDILMVSGKWWQVPGNHRRAVSRPQGFCQSFSKRYCFVSTLRGKPRDPGWLLRGYKVHHGPNKKSVQLRGQWSACPKRRLRLLIGTRIRQPALRTQYYVFTRSMFLEMATRYNEPIPSQQMSEGILQVVQKKQIRNWQSTTSGFLLDWRNELMASLTCARSSTGCTALRAGVYQSILNPQRKGCCSKTKADEFGWQTDQHLFSSIFQVFFHVVWSSLIL